MKAFLRIVLILLLVAGVAGGIWYYRNQSAAAQGSSAATGTYRQVVTAQRGDLSSSITVVGQLDAAQTVELAFERLSGSTALRTLDVAAGNTVRKGDALATVDSAPYEQAVDEAKSDLQSAQAALADLQSPATELEIRQADLSLAQARQQLEQAKSDLADLQEPDPQTLTSLKNAVVNAQDALALARLDKTLAENGSTAKSVRDLQYSVGWHDRKLNEYQQLVSAGKANKEQTEAVATEQEALGEARASLANVEAQHRLALQTAGATVTAAEVALADAQEALADARAGGDALELAKAQLAIKEAEVALIEAQDARSALDEGADAADLAAAQASVDQKKLALAEAEADLYATTLAAPFDGTVLAVSVDPGDTVTSSIAIMTIADMSRLRVLASVDETTIRTVATGQQAAVTFDALPGQTLSGVIGEIPLQGALQGDVMVYEVPVLLDDTGDLPLLVGMTADVTILTGDAQDALLVPTMALTKSNGMYQVLVADPADPEAEPQAVPVEVGLSDGTYTQVTAGLNEGDQVVVELTSGSTTNFGFPGGGMMMLDGGPPDMPQQRPGSSTGSGRGG